MDQKGEYHLRLIRYSIVDYSFILLILVITTTNNNKNYYLLYYHCHKEEEEEELFYIFNVEELDVKYTGHMKSMLYCIGSDIN